jgi:outer membrane lipoprotein-sorting protein
MKCSECRDNLVAHAEGLLDPEESLQCRSHLEACADCRAEYASITNLQHRLIDGGREAAKVSLIDAVMLQIQAVPQNTKRETTMKRFFSGWGFRLSAATCAVAAVTLMLVFSPGTQVKAGQVMARGAEAVAKLGSIHLQCRIRARSNDNFVSIDPNGDYSTLELWKQFGSNTKWRIEKPGRVAVMDGQSAFLYQKQTNTAFKDRPSMDAFDTRWLQHIADLSETINHELHNARSKGWKLKLAEEKTADGRMKSVVTILAKPGIPDDDYLKNKSIDDSDTRRVYRFDAQTGILEGAQFFLTRASGDLLLFEITSIECNRPIDASIFRLQLPENVTWWKAIPLQAGDDKYIAMTPEQAARPFLEACGREDWSEAAKLLDGVPISEKGKRTYGGLVVRGIGQAFKSKASTSHFVPYEIQLRNGEVKKHNLAMRRNEKTSTWFVDGGY